MAAILSQAASVMPLFLQIILESYSTYAPNEQAKEKQIQSLDVLWPQNTKNFKLARAAILKMAAIFV